MPYDDDTATKIPTQLSDFSIDLDQWKILKPLSEASSEAVKKLDIILTSETLSAAIFDIGEL